jgi:hypothetical protein
MASKHVLGGGKAKESEDPSKKKTKEEKAFGFLSKAAKSAMGGH